LETKQEVQLQLEENFSSLQEEVEVKTKKLKKLFAKFKEVTEEINDLKDEFRIEKEDLLDTIRELSKELSLKISITENFIPVDEEQKMEQLAVYDEENDLWKIKKVKPKPKTFIRPVSLSTIDRPISQFAKLVMPMEVDSVRYRYDNIISFQVFLIDLVGVTRKDDVTRYCTKKGWSEDICSARSIRFCAFTR
jgi:kinesin family protein 3/17